MNEILESILTVPKIQQEFIKEFIGKIQYFKCHTDSYEFSTQPNATPIKNTDLWIEAHIEFIPGLIEFRNHVRKEMDRLNLTRYSDLIYQPEHNHYVYSNIHQLKNLKESFINN